MPCCSYSSEVLSTADLLPIDRNLPAPQLAQQVRDHLFFRQRDPEMSIGEEPDINALAAELLGSGFAVQVSLLHITAADVLP